jgi:hypothetical protein
MRELKVRESYTGDELLEILGPTYDGGDRLFAFGNDEKVVVAQDEGNDNYEVLAVLDKPRLYKGGQDTRTKREKIIDDLVRWVDTQVIAEMVVDHLEEEGDEVTLEACKEAWLGTLENLGSGVGIARTSGEAAHL